MAWTRLALLQAAGEGQDALDKMAALFGYAKVDDKNLGVWNIRGESFSWSPIVHATDGAAEKRPPARFPRVNKIVNLDSNRENTQAPEYIYNPSMRLRPEDMPAGSYSFAAPKPLMPMARLVPLLFNSLGKSRVGNGLDHRCLVQRIARGQALQRLPKRHRQRWPQRLLIIVDASERLEPYWTDFAYIVRQLQRLLGQEAVEAIRFDDDTLGSERSYCLPWPTRDKDQWRLWQPPPTDVAILLLSDLGVDDGRAAVRWQRQLKALQTHPSPVLTLSPAHGSPEDETLCRWLKPNPLNDHVQLPRHPGRNGFNLPKLGQPQLDEILAWLAPLPLIDAGLLRRLRDELHWGDSALEAVIWNHPDMRRTGLGIRLRDDVAERHRQAYQQCHAGSDHARRFWQIVSEHHAGAYQGLKQLEALNCCILENQDDAVVREYFQRLCATAMQSEASRQQALQAQCRTILASRSRAIWNSGFGDLAYSIFAAAHGDSIRDGKWPEHLDQEFDPARLAWLVDTPIPWEKEWWQIVQVGDQGQIKCEPIGPENEVRLPLIKLEVPKPFPPKLTLIESGRAITRMLQSGETVALPNNGVAVFESRAMQLELEAIKRPSWASRIWCNAAGLFVNIPWLGQQLDVPWQSSASNSNGHWLWPTPFGEDQYGLYADLTVNEVIQRFRWIEPGTFMMGPPENEAGHYNHEAHLQVTLSQGFWLADTAVTQVLWLAVMGRSNEFRFVDNLNKPMNQVSWYDAQNFIERLNSLIPGLKAQLPSEAQWEYACRAGTSTPFPFGDNINPEQVNYNGEYPYAGGGKGTYHQTTVPVKSLPANPWGLYEMHGNVWEWCQDSWQEKLQTEPLTDPVVLTSKAGAYNSLRVVRGGTNYGYRRGVPCGYRNQNQPGSRNAYQPIFRDMDIGFRLALDHTVLHPVQPGGAKEHRLLHLGDEGPHVLRLQKQLNAKGAHIVADGIFGPSTKQAVIEFQRQNRLIPDGVVGPNTSAALWSAQRPQ